MQLDYFAPQMPKPTAKTTLYRLIEAGYLARRALLEPLLALGLQPGDDALLLGLVDPEGETDDNLSALTGLPKPALDDRLTRLEAQDFLHRQAVGPELLAGARLTEKGQEVAEVIGQHWERLDEALIGELTDKDRKKLRKILKRFALLLEME